MKQKNFKTCAYRFKRFARRAYAVFNSMHKVVNIGVVVGCTLTFAHVSRSAAQGQTSVVHDSLPEQELGEVIVASSKAEVTFNQTAKLVRVITRDEIERQPVQSIQDLLKNVVGIDVRQRGANGVQADVSVRGGTFDQVAILLNGANLTNPQTGHYSLDLPINLSDIERIEIIQGPTALLYGAGAFSGGVNIITKKDADSGVYMKAGGGMYALWELETRGSLKTASSNHSLSAGYGSSDGYIANSDYKIFNALWQSNFKIDRSKLDVQLGINDKNYGANTFYSARFPNQYDETQNLFAAIKGEAGTQLKLIPQLYWNRHYDCFQLIKGNPGKVPYNYHQTDVFGFNLNMQYKWQGGITNFGGEIRNEGIFSSSLGNPMKTAKKNYTNEDNRTNVSYFLEHTYLYNNFTLGLGLLSAYNTAYANDGFGFYPNINLAYRFFDDWKIFASWNNAVRLPTFTDLYYKGDTTHKGFPDLKSEKSESLDLGFQYHNPVITASLSGFYMKGKNMIDWVKEKPEDLLWEARNITNLNKTGVEASFSLYFKQLIPALSSVRLDLSYLFMNQETDAGQLISNYVLDYLRHKLTVGLSHSIDKNWSVDWQFRWQKREGSYSKYENLVFIGEESYSAFSLLDLKINRKINNFNVYLSANNLFNTAYYDLGNLPQPGFWMMGGISLMMK